jgi:hypothetical protein
VFVVSAGYSQGLFSFSAGEHWVDDIVSDEMLGWRNVVATLRESWFLIVIVGAYLVVKRWNDKLDREEMEIIKMEEGEENEDEGEGKEKVE